MAVVVPVYNGTRFIGKTVESILAQSYENFELVLVNDGSTDQSLDILHTLSRDNDRIKVFSKDNGGIASARNHGIRQSTAPLIAFCDQDDLWEPEKLEMQVPVFDDPEVGLCYADTVAQAAAMDAFPHRHMRPEGFVFDELLGWNFISSCSVMLRRSLLDEFGAFDEDRRLMGVDDWLCWLEVSLRSKFARVPQPLCTHVQHEGNYSRNYLAMTEAEIVCIDKIAKSAESLNVHRDWSSLKQSILDSRGRLCVTKGDFRNGAKLFSRANQEKSSIRLYLKSLIFNRSPQALLLYLQKIKRIIPQRTI